MAIPWKLVIAINHPMDKLSTTFKTVNLFYRILDHIAYTALGANESQ